MKKKRILIAISVALIFATIFILASRETIGASDVRIVRIHIETTDGTKKVYLEPENIWITEGSIVVWVNQGPTKEEVKIVFTEGTKCQDVTEAGNAFTLEASCYVTSWVAFGGTSSLKFNEAGGLDYVVESTSGVKAKGTITVHSIGVWWKK